MRLVKLYLVVVSLFITKITNAEEYQQVHACDEYAAHPNDPNRWAAGITDEQIIPGPSVKYCREAVEAHPDTPRFQFQLARALWAAYQFEEGLDVFLKLENAVEYGPVYAYLGDAYLYGIGGLEVDQELAVSLYVIADEFGFPPAGEVLAALSADPSIEAIPDDVDTASVTQSEIETTLASRADSMNRSDSGQATRLQTAAVESPFSRSDYLESNVMEGLYHGNFQKVSLGTTKYIKADTALFYLQGFLEPFSQNVNFLDGTNSCIDLYQPALAKHITFKVARGAPGSEVLFGGDLNAASRQGWQMMGEMLGGLANGGGMMNNSITQTNINMALLKTNGEKDAVRLIKRYGCESDTVKRVFANVTAFAMDRAPVVSTQEKARLKEEQALRLRQAEADRQLGLRTAAAESCVSQFKKQGFCDCLVRDLDKAKISDAEWGGLGSSFKQIIPLGRKYEGLRDSLKACRSGG